MAGKWSFVWTYLEEDGYLRRYAHDSYSSTQECHVGRTKMRIKEDPATMKLGFSDYRSLMKKRGFSDYRSLMKTTKGLHADGLP